MRAPGVKASGANPVSQPDRCAKRRVTLPEWLFQGREHV